MQVFNTLVQHSRCDYHCSFVSWFFRIVRSLSILKFTRFLLFRLRISRCICLCVSNDEPFLCMDLASVHHLKHRKTFQFRSLFFLFATVFFLRFHFFCGSSCSLLSRINFDPSKFVKHYNPFGLFDNKALKAVCSNVQSLFSVRLFLYHFIYLKLLWLVFIGALVLLFVIISLVTQVLSFVPTAERTFISRFHCRCATMDVWRSICAHNAKTRFDSVYRSFLSVAHRVS